MAFTLNGTLSPYGAPVLRSKIITNSITTTVMDSVKMASGFVALGTAGALVFGHVDSIGSKQGLGLNTSGAAGSEIGSFVDTFLTTSTNQTVAMVKANCDVSKHTLYSAELTAAPGTTTGSNLSQYTFDLSDEDTLDEASAATTTGQYMSEGLDPANSQRVIVHIFESQVYGV